MAPASAGRSPNLFDSAQPTEHAPVSILEAATKIARDKTAAHNAKLAVLRVFSESFEQAAKQFTSGTENSIAKQVATKFLKFWTQSLAELEEPPKPTYSSVLASGKPKQGQLAFTASAPPQRKPQTTTRLPGRPPVAPPKEDLRVSSDLTLTLRPETTKDTQSGPTSPLESVLTCAAFRQPSR
ncbi:endonuclease-reverse transcriptase domain-containing protein [Hirsutella rhossiliensis]